MRSTHDQPLPGDLVISAEPSGNRLQVAVFTIAVWPGNDLVAGPYQSYGYALRQGRELALKRSVQLWRDHSSDRQRPELENVTT